MNCPFRCSRADQYPITRIMHPGPYEGHVPLSEYNEDATPMGRIQPYEIAVTGH
jgi:hypothetical protein